MMMIPIVVTLVGIVTAVSDVHPKKTPSPSIIVIVIKMIVIDSNDDDTDDDNDMIDSI